tara:strand:- start:40 stop:264 length:225 start_codon:yes stop_codon:yes gene_type:complete
MDSQLKIDRNYIEAEISQFGGEEEDRLMKILEKTSDDELSLKMWRVDQAFMDRISELGSDMVSELLDKLGEKDE